MAPNLWFYQLLLAVLVLICLILHVWWPAPVTATPPPHLQPDKPRRKRSKEPKPFTGYIQKPLIFETVVKILGHVYPLRALCKAAVVWVRLSARDSRIMSRAIRPSKQTWLRTRYTLFCILR